MGKETMGSFIAQLRHENELTQKALAVRLHVTDKAVSKWECGQSYPDIELLEPMADIFQISITELIQGRRLPQPDSGENVPTDAGAPVSGIVFCYLLVCSAVGSVGFNDNHKYGLTIGCRMHYCRGIYFGLYG